MIYNNMENYEENYEEETPMEIDMTIDLDGCEDIDISNYTLKSGSGTLTSGSTGTLTSGSTATLSQATLSQGTTSTISGISMGTTINTNWSSNNWVYANGGISIGMENKPYEFVHIWENDYDVEIEANDFCFDELYEINNMLYSDYIKKYEYAIKNKYDSYTKNTFYSELYRIAITIRDEKEE